MTCSLFHIRHRWVLLSRERIPGTVNATHHLRCSVCGRETVKLGY